MSQVYVNGIIFHIFTIKLRLQGKQNKMTDHGTVDTKKHYDRSRKQDVKWQLVTERIYMKS
jgi:hypothetical protein